MTQTKSQNIRILDHLSKGKSLTTLEAFYRFGTLRCSGRIFELKQAGANIQSETIKVKDKRVSRYWIDKECPLR